METLGQFSVEINTAWLSCVIATSGLPITVTYRAIRAWSTGPVRRRMHVRMATIVMRRATTVARTTAVVAMMIAGMATARRVVGITTIEVAS